MSVPLWNDLAGIEDILGVQRAFDGAHHVERDLVLVARHGGQF